MTLAVASTSAIAKTPAIPEKVSVLQNILLQNKAALMQALPKHLSIDRLIRIACSAASRDSKLLKCTTSSLLKSIMQSCQLGLDPGGALGGAYLIPYGTECTLIIGYRGLIDLARRSGHITSLEAHVIYKKDEFDIAFGLEPVLKHRPTWESDPGEVVGAYAIARFKSGDGLQYEFMSRAQIDAIKKRSRASSSGPWVTDYDEMARKTVVKRLCKYLPLSVELADSIDEDNRVEFGENEGLTLDPDDEIAPVSASSGKTEVAKEKLRQGAALDKSDPPPPHDPDTGEVADPYAGFEA